jgi:two-component system chemotaxis sensor kinase CheA
LPVILVTSLASNEDRKKGLEAGANAYIAKPAFDQQLLLETLKRLI